MTLLQPLPRIESSSPARSFDYALNVNEVMFPLLLRTTDINAVIRLHHLSDR